MFYTQRFDCILWTFWKFGYRVTYLMTYLWAFVVARDYNLYCSAHRIFCAKWFNAIPADALVPCAVRLAADLILNIIYRKISNIRHTNPETKMFLFLICSCLCVIHLSRERRCSWSSAERRCSNYIWVMNNFITHWGASYIRDLMVIKCSRLNINHLCHFNIDKWHMIQTGHVAMGTIAEVTILVPYRVVKSLYLIWRLGTRWWNLQVPGNELETSVKGRAPG